LSAVALDATNVGWVLSPTRYEGKTPLADRLLAALP
jgi:hypothetical protein